MPHPCLHTLALLLCLALAPQLHAQQSDTTQGDLWYFQLHGPVRSIDLRGLHCWHVEFDRQGRITRMTQDHLPVTLHRDTDGRLLYITGPTGRLHDHTDTSYRERATDERGNWMARKTQRQPYTIGTEYCRTVYYP